MLKFRRFKGRGGYSTERADDLSIVTGLQNVRHLGSLKKRSRMVRSEFKENIILRQQFQLARECAKIDAYSRAKDSRAAQLLANGNAAAAKNENDQKSKSVSAAAATSHATTSASFAPTVLKTFTGCTFQNSRKVCNGEDMEEPLGPSRNKPPSTLRRFQSASTSVPRFANSRWQDETITPIVGRKLSETEYWTSFTSSGRASRSFSSPYCSSPSFDSASNSKQKPSSAWPVRSSFPINRTDAHMVQQEMASSIISGYGTNKNVFCNSLRRVPPSSNQGHVNSSQPQTSSFPFPSLLRSIQAPTPSSTTQNTVYGLSNTNTPKSVNQNECVLIGEWVTRNDQAVEAGTKQYSITQLIDMLTGDAVPPTSEIAGRIFNPAETESLNEDPIPPFKTGSNRRKNKKVNRALHEINDNWNSRGDNTGCNFDQDHDHSIYFSGVTPSCDRLTNQRKSVSFLTDADDNIAPQMHVFDRFTQEFLGSNPPSQMEDVLENHLPLDLSLSRNRTSTSQTITFPEVSSNPISSPITFSFSQLPSSSSDYPRNIQPLTSFPSPLAQTCTTFDLESSINPNAQSSFTRTTSDNSGQSNYFSDIAVVDTDQPMFSFPS